jgi:cytochrome c oxidase assembly protein subunit 11
MEQLARRKTVTAVVLFGVVAGMVGMSFAAVPLYRMFCQVTGIAGTPRTENVVRAATVGTREVTVKFDANVNPALPWQFQPAVRSVRVKVGEEAIVHYVARNTSDHPVTGTATFNVVPEKAARFFNKLECFCFTEQTLVAGQSIDMPVLFFIDPAMADDAEARDVREVTLSYTFFKIPDPAPAKAVLGARDGAGKGEGVGG